MGARGGSSLETKPGALSVVLKDAAHAIAVVLIRARSNRIDDLRPLVPQILATIAASKPGTIRVVGA